MTFDEARDARPAFGFAVYAYEPGGPITLEVHTPLDGMFTFEGPTLQSALDRAFPPPLPEPEPAAEEPTPNAFD
jgi:hypothetical protein